MILSRIGGGQIASSCPSHTPRAPAGNDRMRACWSVLVVTPTVIDLFCAAASHRHLHGDGRDWGGGGGGVKGERMGVGGRVVRTLGEG